MLEQVLVAFTLKVGEILEADRVALFLVDRDQRQLWSKVAQDDGDEPLDIRVPLDSGIIGHVASTGEVYNATDAYDDPRFNRTVDARTGYRTRSVLCVPMRNQQAEIFAVAEVLNRKDGRPFDAVDERRFAEFGGSIGVLLESWWRMSRDVQQPANRKSTSRDTQRVWGGAAVSKHMTV
jgi:adenylate cyclase